MARLLTITIILVLFAAAAWGADDVVADQFGVYFDEYGTQICKDTIPIASPFSIWFVYTEPSAESILGFEAGYHTTAQFLQLGIYPPCGIIWTVQPELDDLYVACSEPMATAEATPLFRIDYLALGTESPDSVFYLEKARNSALPGNNPHIILEDGSLLEVQAQVPAYTTLCCGVPTTEVEWGSIKSLYR